MAEYRAERITEVARADDQTSARISLASGAEQTTLLLDWKLASELIDRLAVVNNQIRHALTAPDTRAQRIQLGCHRTGIVLAALTVLPVVWGLWAAVQGALDTGGWKIIGAFLLAAPVVYGAVWAIGWVTAAFIGNRQPPAEKRSDAATPQVS